MIEEYLEEICDTVCKHRERWFGEGDDFIDTVCAECAATKLAQYLREEAPLGVNPWQE